jgi:hypothetical protein
MMPRWAINWMRERIVSPLLDPLPDLRAQPDLTGSGLDMQWMIDAMGENKEVPREGDVIVRVVSCGMGTTVRFDWRYRVKGPGRFARSVEAIKEDGTVENLHIFYMRRHAKLARTWILMD